MSKSKKRNTKRRTRTSRRHKKSRSKSNLARGKSLATNQIPNNNIVQCCICERTFPRDDTLVPARCLKENRERAHRICQDCWWDPETGFARENAPHGCPGCIKNFPLTAPLKRVIPKIEDIIVISD